MYHKFRIIVASLAIMMLCVLSSSLTISYFTDTKIATNNFTIGNASTALSIYDNLADEKHIFNANDYSPLTDRDDIKLYLQATNDGNIPVYQRFRVVIPKALASAITLNLSDMDNCSVETNSEHTCANENYTVSYNPNVNDTYAEYYIVSNNILDLNASTVKWATQGLKIDGISSIDTSEFVCSDNSGNNCKLWINVYSDAIQTTGFTDAVSAFANFAETYN